VAAAVAPSSIAWLLVSLYGRGNFVATSTLLNIVERATALGIVAVGQTFAILVGSLDLSVAYLISVTAVMTSFIMQGDPSRVPLALAVVTAHRPHRRLHQRPARHQGAHQPAHRHARHGADPARPPQRLLPELRRRGLALVPAAGLRHARAGPRLVDPVRRRGGGRRAGAGPHALRRAPLRGGRRPRHRSPVGHPGGPHRHRRAHGRLLHRRAHGLYLASRLRSGAPWIGPDGVYDLESIAAVVVGGTVLAGGRGGVLGTIAGVLIFAILDVMFNQLGIGSYTKQVLRGFIIIGAVAIYAYRSREVVG
jgi:ribose transport system permease protein